MNDLQNAMDDVEIGDDAWYELAQNVLDVTASIQESQTAIEEYQNAINELRRDDFDRIMDDIHEIVEESEFLIDLLSNADMVTETGELTSEGLATVGQHNINYNLLIEGAERYGRELERIQSQ